MEYVLIVLAQVVVADSYCFRDFNGSDVLHSSQLSRLEPCIIGLFATSKKGPYECFLEDYVEVNHSVTL
jgi:hypothetical protein